MYPGNPCKHSNPKGCTNYENRQQDPCRSFHCAWILEDSQLPDWLKPDNSKAIVVRDKWKWNGYPVDLAVAVGKKIPPRTLKWLMEFAEKHQRLLIYTEQIIEDGNYLKQQEFTGFGPPAFQRDLLQWKKDGKIFEGI
jgi:hypothetical protein